MKGAAMNGLITQLGYLGIEVTDMARWERFAAEVLGLSVSAGPSADTRWLRMDEQRQRFVLTSGPADDLAFAGWQVANAEAIAAFAEVLDAKSIRWTRGTDDELALRAVQQMIHFKDPVGNRHEVYCGPQLASDRFVSPKVASGFVTGGEGLGHIVYSSSEYAKSLAFARDVLGMADSDQIRVPLGPGMSFEVSFLHTNARHHSYAVAPQPPVPGAHKCIHHFMIEVNSVDEVGFARDRCLAMGQAVQMDIGQHPNDKMISFYGQTPSGFFVEFGWGGAKVDPATWQVVTYDKLSEWGHRPNSEVALRVASSNTQEKKPMSANGLWNVVIKTPMGSNEVVFDLQVEGNDVHGSIKGPKETNEIFDGKVDGNNLTWGAKVSTPIPMTLAFTATIDGDSISGGAKSPFGTAPFSGTRA
jgi:biphenyl-2,3-diol 1,2-dioxygenase